MCSVKFIFWNMAVMSVLIVAFCYLYDYPARGRAGSLLKSQKLAIAKDALKYRTISLGSTRSCFTTVVSAFFTFANNSKHPLKHYEYWLPGFFQSVKAPLVILTDPYTLPLLLETRPEMLYQTTVYVYENVWELVREMEKAKNKSYEHAYKHQNFTHFLPELYAYWNMKPYLTRKAAELNLYNSTYFIYTDAGAFREQRIFGNWPNSTFIKHDLLKRTGDQMFFGQHYHFSPFINIKYCYDNAIILEGTFFSGTLLALREFEPRYYKVHDEMIAKRMFIGDDQCVLHLVVFGDKEIGFMPQINATRLNILGWILNNECGDPWFFYQRFLGSERDYRCPIAKEKLYLTGHYTKD